MSSLFDIAAGLSQFDGGGEENLWSTTSKDSGDTLPPELDIGLKNNSKSPGISAKLPPARRHQSALGILDETLQTIYDTRRASSSAPSTMAVSRSSEQLENRLRQLNATTFTLSTSSTSLLLHSGSASELRNVFTHSIAYQQQLEAATTTRAERTPSPPTSKARGVHTRNQNQNGDPDLLAKTILREINDEIEQLGTASHHDHRTPEQRDAIVRFLTEKYLDARLNKLPTTPFVQLARRKALQKIRQLQRQSTHTEITHSQRSAEPADASTASYIQPNQQQQERHHHQQLEDASELWEKLSALPPQQREMLQKLARVPEAQLSSLPPAQRELVQFAKRLERARAMSPQELSRLAPSHQQLIRKLQAD